MSSLYELTGQALYLQDMLESGNIDEQTYQDTLEGLDIDTKISNICSVIRNLEADATMYKNEKDRLAEKQKIAENGVKRLKDTLLNYLTATNQSKVNSGIFSVTSCKTDKVSVTDEKIIPSEFLIPQPDKIDLSSIKTALKNGKQINGVELIKSEYVRIK